jgi:hypothetical protein
MKVATAQQALALILAAIFQWSWKRPRRFAGFAGVPEGAQLRHHVGAELAVEFPSEALLRAA